MHILVHRNFIPASISFSVLSSIAAFSSMRVPAALWLQDLRSMVLDKFGDVFLIDFYFTDPPEANRCLSKGVSYISS